MNKPLGKNPKISAESLINWSALSQLLANNTDSVRQNRVPNKYKEEIQTLMHYIKCWKINQKLILPKEFEEKIRNLDLISIILDEK